MDNFSWMSQPGLVFEMDTGRGRAPVEPASARSDPSSANSSQDEDSLERLTPDSPFEDLTEKAASQEAGQEADILRAQTPRVLEEVHLPASARPTNEAGDVELTNTGNVLQTFQPKLAGSTVPTPRHLGPGLQSELFSDLDVDLDLRPSVDLVTAIGPKSSMESCSLQSSSPTVANVTESSTRVVDPKSPTADLVSVPSPEMPPGGQMDEVWCPAEEVRISSSSFVKEMARHFQEAPPAQCPVRDLAAVSAPEPTEVDSSGESEDTVIEDLKGQPGCPLPSRVELQTPAPMMAATSTGEAGQESGARDGRAIAVGTATGDAGSQPGDVRASKVDQAELTKVSKIEDHIVLAKGSLTENQAELTKVSKIEDHIVLAKGSLMGNQAELTKVSKIEDHVGLGQAFQVEEGTEGTKASKTEDHVGSPKATKVDNQVELAKTSKVEFQAKDLKMEKGGLAIESKTGDQLAKTEEQAGLTKGSKMENLVGLSRASKTDQAGLTEWSQAVDQAGGPAKIEAVGLTLGPAMTSDPATSPTLEMAAQASGWPEEEPDLGDTSTSLLEMIRRSEMQRCQLARDQGSTPCTADQPVAVVPSAPVCVETPPSMVKPLRSTGSEPMDLDLQTKVGSVDLDLQNKVKPVDLDLQNKVGSVDVDLQNKVGSVDVDLQNKVKPVDLGLQNKVGSVSLDLQTKVGPVDVGLQSKVGSVDLNLQNKVKPVDLDLQNKVGSVDLDLQNKVGPVDVDLQNKGGFVDLDLQNKVGSVDVDLQSKVGSVDLNLQNKVKPVDLDLQNKGGFVDLDLQNKVGPVDVDLQNKGGFVDLDLQNKVGSVDLDLQNKVGSVDLDLQNKVGPVDVDLLGDVRPVADAPRPRPDKGLEPPAGVVNAPAGDQRGERPEPSPPSRDLAAPVPVDAGPAGGGTLDTPVLGEASERPNRTPARELVYWTDPRKSAAVFGSALTLLVSLAVFSVVSVLAYLVLALLSVTISFRVYRSVLQAVQKTQDGNPFKAYLEQDVTVSPDAFHHYCTTGLAYVNQALKYLLRLFLVHDLIDSLKLTALMWLMTYVGAVFNGLTLLILALLLTFSVPAVYKKYQTEVDQYLDVAQKQVNSIVEKIQEKIPGTKRKNE